MVEAEIGNKEYTIVYRGRTLAVGLYDCRQKNEAEGGEQTTRSHNINFPHTGIYEKQVGRRSFLVDTHHAVFFNAGEPYRTRHPHGTCDRGAYLKIAPALLVGLLSDLDPALGEDPRRPFPLTHSLVEPRSFLDQHLLVNDLLAGTVADPLEAEERILSVVRDVLTQMNAFREVRRRAPERPGADDPRDLVQGLIAILGQRFTEQLGLDQLAELTGYSTHHLCRVFRRVTGTTIHSYRDRLRLHEALLRLLDGDTGTDLTSLALELGYSSHSHFSTRFRAAFHVTPSAVRRL